MKTIHIVDNNLARGWERAVLDCWWLGDSFTTHYDRPGDPPSKDIMLTLHVLDPFEEPRIHRGMPAGLNDLEKYRAEVLLGVHDHWMDKTDKTKWQYTYHQRLFGYETYLGGGGTVKVDQIESVVMELKRSPFSRRAQAITWQPWIDPAIEGAPCLQGLWFRVQGGKLNMVAHIRSNDAFKAGFMNMYAFTELQAYVAKEIGVAVGEYVHVAESFHIYGQDYPQFEGFLKLMDARPNLVDRTYTTETAREEFVIGCDELLGQELPDAVREKVARRRAELIGA